MKTLLVTVFLAAIAVTVFAQEQFEGLSSQRKLGTPEAPGVKFQMPFAPKNSTNFIVTARGFLIDIGSTNRPLKMMSLRNPADKTNDHKNIVRDPANGRVLGLKLISFDF